MTRERNSPGKRGFLLGIVPMWIATTLFFLLLLAAFTFVTVRLAGHSDPMRAVLERVSRQLLRDRGCGAPGARALPAEDEPKLDERR